MSRALAVIEEYDHRLDKSFIFDVKGDYDKESGVFIYMKDGEVNTIRHEEDLTREGCRIRLKKVEEV